LDSGSSPRVDAKPGLKRGETLDGSGLAVAKEKSAIYGVGLVTCHWLPIPVL